MIKANHEEKINAVLKEIKRAKNRIHNPIVNGFVAKITENLIDSIEEIKNHKSI